MSENEKLDYISLIRDRLKVPKGEEAKDKYGKTRYNYRTLDGIFQALKPILKEYNCQLDIDTEPLDVAGFPVIKATAVLTTPDGKTYKASASAREDKAPAMMSMPQASGSALTYSVKYALGLLFLIEDTGDIDPDQVGDHDFQQKIEKRNNPQASQNELQQINALLDQLSTIKSIPKEVLAQKFLDAYQVNFFKDMSSKVAQTVINQLKNKIN